MPLVPCADVSAATWLTAEALPWPQLVTFGPAGFAAYARLRFIPYPAFEGQSENDVEVDADHPSDASRLRIALDTLSRHTTTPHDCYFCLWDGWGFGGGDAHTYGADPQRQIPVAPAFPPAVLDGPKVVVPHRAYFLFRGPLSEVGKWGAAEMWPGQPRTEIFELAFVWPADRAWCVAKDVDPHWAGIGAAAPAVDELLRDLRIDVVAADPSAQQPRYR